MTDMTIRKEDPSFAVSELATSFTVKSTLHDYKIYVTKKNLRGLSMRTNYALKLSPFENKGY